MEGIELIQVSRQGILGEGDGFLKLLMGGSRGPCHLCQVITQRLQLASQVVKLGGVGDILLLQLYGVRLLQRQHLLGKNCSFVHYGLHVRMAFENFLRRV